MGYAGESRHLRGQRRGRRVCLIVDLPAADRAGGLRHGAGLPQRARPDGRARLRWPRSPSGSGSAWPWSTCRTSRPATWPSRPPPWTCCPAAGSTWGSASAGCRRSSPSPARPWPGAGPRTREYIEVLRHACGRRRPAFTGQDYQVPAGRIAPRPVQRPGPPVLLGGIVPAALQRVGRYADGWVTSSRTDLSRIGEGIAVVRAAAEAGGPGPGRHPDHLPRRGPRGRPGDGAGRRRPPAAVRQLRRHPRRRPVAGGPAGSPSCSTT